MWLSMTFRSTSMWVKMIKLPEMIKLPSKMLPLILQFNDFLYFLFYGGRSGGKSHSVGRFLLYLGAKKKLRIFCGREQQNSIEDSVYTLLITIINKYKLPYDIYKDRIVCKTTGSVFRFRGFFERGAVNIKGLEDVDILWMDEAQAITQVTLDTILPTIRKNKSRIIFTMNRKRRNDPVFKEFAKDENCFCQKINYVDNPYNNEETIAKAEKCRINRPADFRHIWLGEPEDESDNFIFNVAKLDVVQNLKISRTATSPIKSMAVDLSGAGGDLCVANLIEQYTETEYQQTQVVSWGEKDTEITIGKIIYLYSQWKPDILTVDADGMGYPIFCSLRQSIPDIIPFNGGGKSNIPNCLNQRADGYIIASQWVNDKIIKITNQDVIRQFEYIRKEFSTAQKGKIKIQSKVDIKSEQGESPDFADSTMMNIYALNYKSHLAYDKKYPYYNNSQNTVDEYGW